MGTDMLAIGISGLHAAQLGLQVTQHNIANANTEGYNRQSLLNRRAQLFFCSQSRLFSLDDCQYKKVAVDSGRSK